MLASTHTHITTTLLKYTTLHLKNAAPLACYKSSGGEPISIIFDRNVTKKVRTIKDALFSCLT